MSDGPIKLDADVSMAELLQSSGSFVQLVPRGSFHSDDQVDDQAEDLEPEEAPTIMQLEGPAARELAEVLLGESVADGFGRVRVTFNRDRLVIEDLDARPIEVSVKFEAGDLELECLEPDSFQVRGTLTIVPPQKG